MNDNDLPGDSITDVVAVLETAMSELIVELVNSKKLARRRAADVVARVMHTARNMHPESEGFFTAQQFASSVSNRLGLAPEISVAKEEIMERGQPLRRAARTMDEALARQAEQRRRRKNPGNHGGAEG